MLKKSLNRSKKNILNLAIYSWPLIIILLMAMSQKSFCEDLTRFNGVTTYIDNSIDSLEKYSDELLTLSMRYEDDTNLSSIHKDVVASKSALISYGYFRMCYNFCDSCMWCLFGMIKEMSQIGKNLQSAKFSSVMLVQAGQEARLSVILVLDLLERIRKNLLENNPAPNSNEKAEMDSLMQKFNNMGDSTQKNR
jgi:hypothetical protein